MGKKRIYEACYKVNLDCTEFALIGTDDTSSNSIHRSEEVLQMVTKMYRLAFKTGRVSKLEREEYNESA